MPQIVETFSSKARLRQVCLWLERHWDMRKKNRPSSQATA
jgi:hypothetical protein